MKKMLLGTCLVAGLMGGTVSSVQALDIVSAILFSPGQLTTATFAMAMDRADAQEKDQMRDDLIAVKNGINDGTILSMADLPAGDIKDIMTKIEENPDFVAEIENTNEGNSHLEKTVNYISSTLN